jgi:hypothetical protein
MFTTSNVSSLRHKAEGVRDGVSSGMRGAHPAPGNPNRPIYELAEAIITLCDYVEELRVEIA